MAATVNLKFTAARALNTLEMEADANIFTLNGKAYCLRDRAVLEQAFSWSWITVPPRPQKQFLLRLVDLGSLLEAVVWEDRLALVVINSSIQLASVARDISTAIASIYSFDVKANISSLEAIRV